MYAGLDPPAPTRDGPHILSFKASRGSSADPPLLLACACSCSCLTPALMLSPCPILPHLPLLPFFLYIPSPMVPVVSPATLRLHALLQHQEAPHTHKPPQAHHRPVLSNALGHSLRAKWLVSQPHVLAHVCSLGTAAIKMEPLSSSIPTGVAESHGVSLFLFLGFLTPCLCFPQPKDFHFLVQQLQISGGQGKKNVTQPLNQSQSRNEHGSLFYPSAPTQVRLKGQRQTPFIDVK